MVEEIKEDATIREKSFEERILASEADLKFVRFFRDQNVCWRCICLMFRETADLELFRSQARIAKLEEVLIESANAATLAQIEAPC